MADFSVTAAGVVKRSGATTTSGTAGATITAGKAVYLDSNDSKWKLGNCETSTTTAGLNGVGVALHGAADGQPLNVITAGDWYAGAAAVEGEDYYMSGTAGGLAPRADLSNVAPDYRTLVCTGLANGDMRMLPSYTGAQVQ